MCTGPQRGQEHWALAHFRVLFGWQVVEGDAAGVAELEAMWGDLLELQITPVIEDAEAASSLAKVHRK